MMSSEKRKEIQFRLEALWIDYYGGNRRSWLFYIFCVLSSLSTNGKENISVNQYFKQYASSHDTENAYSAIIIVDQQKIKIQIRKKEDAHEWKSHILGFQC